MNVCQFETAAWAMKTDDSLSVEIRQICGVTVENRKGLKTRA